MFHSSSSSAWPRCFFTLILLFPVAPRLEATETYKEDPGKEGDGTHTIGPEYKIDPDLTDRGNPKGKSFEFSMPLAKSKIFRGDDATLEPGKKPVRKERVERFVGLRAELTTLLAITALLIGLATLASGALREAVLAENVVPRYRDKAITCIADASGESATTVRAQLGALSDGYPECLVWKFDRRYVLAYGALFSAMLALAFAPVFIVMRRAGDGLREDAYELPGPSDAAFFEVVEKRRAFDALLQTNLSSTVVFKAGAAILTPLAASLVSTLVPT